MRGRSSQYGNRVALEGDVAVVCASEDPGTAPRTGAAYVYRRQAGVWSTERRIAGPEDVGGAEFCARVDYQGGLLGAISFGTQRVWTVGYAGGGWSAPREVLPHEATGPSATQGFPDFVSVSESWVAVGARDFMGDGAIHTYRRTCASFTEDQLVLPPPGSNLVDLAVPTIDGDWMITAASNAGVAQAVLFHYDGTQWQYRAAIPESEGTGTFGWGRDIDGEGGFAAIGDEEASGGGHVTVVPLED